MKFLKQLFDFYINSSIHVALAVFSLTWLTFLEFGIPYDKPLLYFVFFAAISGYNFVKYFGLAKFHHRSLAKWLRAIQVFSFCCFILMCYYVLQLQTKVLVGILVFGVITFFYAMPLLPKSNSENQKSLRSVSGLKVYLIAMVWSGVTVVLPIVNNDYGIISDALLSFTQRFIYIIVLMIPFEIRDLQYDSPELATIPQKIGIKWTKILGAILLLIFFFMEFLKTKTYQYQYLVLFSITVITALFVMRSKTNQGKYFCSFFVEGLPILWLLLTLLSC